MGAEKMQTEAALLAAERAWGEAQVSKDVARMEALVGETLLYTHSSGRTEDRQRYLTSLESGELQYLHVEYGPMTAASFGEAGYVQGESTIEILYHSERRRLSLRFQHMFVLRDGGWKLVAHLSAAR